MLKEHVGRDDDDEESRGPDRLSELPDHILLCVLERLHDDARSLARTSVLSKRWRTLPLLLSELEITVKTFLPADRTASKLQRVLHATGRFAAAVRFFLLAAGDPGYRRAIKTLTLKLYLPKEVDYLLDILRLVGDAIGRGEVQDLELLVHTVRGKASLNAAPRGLGISLLYGRRFTRLLRGAPPAMLGSLKSLTLRNLFFPDFSAEVGTVLRACPALELLALDFCGFDADGDFPSTLTIDAPRSRLKVLSFDGCFVGRYHVVQAPRLVRLICEEWFSESCPVTFGPGSVPSLEEIVLCNRAQDWHLSFSLIELLENTHGVATVGLAFDNGKIWVKPEGPENLGAALSNLMKLHLMEIFPEGDLSWTVFLLQAARRLELMDIQVYRNHVCWPADADDDDDRDVVRDPEWEVPEGFRHHHLRHVHIGGDMDDGKHVRFMRLVMERAVSLELLVLDARIECEKCVDAQRFNPSIVLSNFPEGKEGVDALVRRQVKGGIATSARVLVYTASNQEFQY